MLIPYFVAMKSFQLIETGPQSRGPNHHQNVVILFFEEPDGVPPGVILLARLLAIAW